MRYLIFLMIVIIVFLLWRASMRRSAGTDAVRPEASAGDMVQCRRCGVYLPKEDAVAEGAFFFCSAEHRDADRV